MTDYTDYRDRITNKCSYCDGSGYREYNHGSTWRRQVVGVFSCTVDVCDYCWGSGDCDNHWTNLREMHQRIKNETNLAGGEWFVERLKTTFIFGSRSKKSIEAMFKSLAEYCSKQTRRRKPLTNQEKESYTTLNQYREAWGSLCFLVETVLMPTTKKHVEDRESFQLE